MTADQDRYEAQVERQRAACDLAIGASYLRDADDALVAHGRVIRDGYAGVGAPTHDEGERAIELADQVARAYAAMRKAEAVYEKTGVQS